MRLMSNFVVHLRIPKFQKKKNCTLMFEIGFMPVKGEQGISYAKKGSPDPFNLVAESQNCQVILLIYTHFILTCVHFVTRGCVCVCVWCVARVECSGFACVSSACYAARHTSAACTST